MAQTQSDEQELGGATAEIEISFKKKGAVSRNWIVLDSSDGEGMILDLDKFDIMSRVPINGRDLRILDPLLSYPSAILVRETAIVLNLEVTTSLFFLFFFFFPSPFFASFFLFCGRYLISFSFSLLQHIKAIITTDEVSL